MHAPLRRVARLSAVVVSLTFVVLTATSAEASTYAAGTGYSWDHSTWVSGQHIDCSRTIGVYVNPANMPAGSLTPLGTALVHTNGGARSHFRYVGSTDRTRATMPAYSVQILYVSAAQMAADGVSPYAFAYASHDRTSRYNRGWVAINAMYAAAYPRWWQVNQIMHELGHVLNLGHARYAGEMMLRDPSRQPRGLWGRGDLVGLDHNHSGC